MVGGFSIIRYDSRTTPSKTRLQEVLYPFITEKCIGTRPISAKGFISNTEGSVAGNTVVCKPSVFCNMSSSLFAERTKGNKISDYSAGEICFFADCINGLPRKILKYVTPEELFEQEPDKIFSA